tara:strand:- start:2914 stop:4032 length:1119 start_codon:yes stop_codon:yes gene_type:complete
MAIKVSGTTVVDNDRNFNVGVLTATSLDVPPTVLSFSPTDGSSDNSIDTNIVITYNTDVQKGSGNITLREGSASGTVIQTIAVSSGTVSISGGQVTINPASDLPTGKDIYVVVDEGAFESTSLGSGTNELNTYNFSTGRITVSSFSPSDGATDQSVSTNIVITFSENIAKGSGNITIRSGSASGTALQTIDVTSGAVSVSGTQATINPPSDLAYETDQYIVVDAGCFTNTDGDAASSNAIINTYNFTTESETLGSSQYGGVIICASSSIYWVISPDSTEVGRNWHSRTHAVTTANSNAACGDWFIPSCGQLQNPGHACKQYWNFTGPYYWSDTEIDSSFARYVYFTPTSSNTASSGYKTFVSCVRAFRCVSY